MTQGPVIIPSSQRLTLKQLEAVVVVLGTILDEGTNRQSNGDFWKRARSSERKLKETLSYNQAKVKEYDKVHGTEFWKARLVEARRQKLAGEEVRL